MHQCLWYGSAHMGYHMIEFENAYCSLTSSYKLLITLWLKERYCDIFTFQFNFFILQYLVLKLISKEEVIYRKLILKLLATLTFKNCTKLINCCFIQYSPKPIWYNLSSDISDTLLRGGNDKYSFVLQYFNFFFLNVTILK